ncbi:MAG: hypothetical protein OWV35_08990 [Firmicutes bacterium]|nr:hypothetical protein [Bacillota bacterium]
MSGQRSMWGAGLVLLAALVAVHSWGTPLEGDVYWQWTAGSLMLARHAVLRTDPFSYTLHGYPWVTEEWGFEVLLAWLVQQLGRWGFWVMGAVPGMAAAGLVYLRLGRRGLGPLPSLVLALGSTFSWLPFVKDRPQVLSYALMALLYVLLDAARAGRTRALWWLLPLAWFWANVHGSFLALFVLVGLEALWAAVPVRAGLWDPQAGGAPAWAYLAAGAGAALATFLNPHGPGLWAYAWRVSLSPKITDTIVEWQSPDFHVAWILAAVAAPLLLTVVVVLARARPVPWRDSVIAAAWLVATLHAVRFLPYWALSWPVLLEGVGPWLTPRRVRPGVVAAVLLAGAAAAAALAPPARFGRPAADIPVGAVRFLRHAPPGRVFNPYHLGGYLIHAGIPVFIDGRTDFYLARHAAVLDAYLGVKHLTTSPQAVFNAWRVRYVLWTPGTALARYLADSPAWRLVYASPRAVVYARAVAPPSGIMGPAGSGRGSGGPR